MNQSNSEPHTIEVEVSDGEVRQFGPGDIVLVGDTFGNGHTFRVIGSQRGYMVAVPVEE
jgi:hypothetical protein